MLELTALTAFVGYIIYLRYYADQRTAAQKEADRLRDGINLYDGGQTADALAYFNAALAEQPKSSVAYLYRARIYHDLGDPAAALTDLNRGKSYDDTVSELHLETGKIHYEQGDYEQAFTDFDKAVFHNSTDLPEPYRWRGMAGQKLRRTDLSRSDLERADTLANAATVPIGGEPAPTAFFDRRFVLHMGLVVLTSTLLLLIIKRSNVIHWPYLAAAIVGVLIGFLETRKGWALAIEQALLLWLGYTFVLGPAVGGHRQDLENFSLYGSIGLTFIGSLLGSVIKRAQG
ncbi:tetratricopeptide repeat protein [Spirosoma rhododendri]|uniref:Tetratricopeptide repeat protein n=1 Tax=Spirosoma rhododendri TaxID=2728024 RepID=A0A7L5DJ03_9BACT|nr:tetratricopeptide repeat protein [Spirosoma rhododendri]QJD77401.1 tetratricopeptide repeat protein [Spirosoma rhododendri]